MCKECHRAYLREHYRNNKQYYVDKARVRNKSVILANRTRMVEYLRQHPCVDCGNSDVEVLEFDHRESSSKISHVANMVRNVSWEKLYEEIEKCDVRCANCHVKKTRRQFGYWLSDDFPQVYPLATNQ